MKYGPKKRSMWVEATVIMLLIAGGIAAFVQNSAAPMGRDELKISAADLRVMASAGSLLAEQYLDGRTTDTFYREQSSLLRDEARSAREDVEETDVVPGAEKQHDALVQLAKETENEIAALADFPQSAPSAEVNLRLIFGRLQALEAELKK